MPFRPSPRQLEYLIAVCQTGHFGAAAKVCNVSQPTLSTQIQLLERQLGAMLIDRSPGRAVPTPIGERIIDLARSTLASLDEIVSIAGHSAGNLGGLIRLGTAPTFGPYFMPLLLPQLHRGYPDLEVYIREDRSSALEEMVAAGSLDCALSPDPGEPERFIYRELLVEPLYVGMAADHRLAAEEVLSPEMLAGENMLTLGAGHHLNQHVRTLCAKSNAILRADYEGTSLDALRQMISIGMGLSLFPAYYAASEFAQREDQVVLRTLHDQPLARSVGLFWRNGHKRTPQFSLLAKECAAVTASLVTEIEN